MLIDIDCTICYFAGIANYTERPGRLLFLSSVQFCLNRKYALGDIRVSVYICTGTVSSGVLMYPRAKATTAVVGQQPGYDDVMAHDGHSGGGRSAAGASPGVA